MTAKVRSSRRLMNIALSAAIIVPALAIAPRAVAQTPSAPVFIPVAPGGSVFGTAISPDGANLWVTNTQAGAATGQVTLVGIPSQAVGASVAVGSFPTGLTFNNAGTLAFVNNGSSASLSTINVPKLVVNNTLDLSGTPGGILPYGLAYESNHLYISNASGTSVPEYLRSDSALSLAKTFKLSGSSGKPAVEAAGKYHNLVLLPVFTPDTVNVSGGHPKIDIISPATGEVVTYLTLNANESYPEAVTVSADGQYAYVALYDQVGGGQGGVWVIDLKTLKTVTVVPTGDDANTDVAVSADGKFLLVTGFLANQVALIDTSLNTTVYVIAAGNGPSSVVITKDGSQAFFANENDGTVGQVSFSPVL